MKGWGRQREETWSSSNHNMLQYQACKLRDHDMILACHYHKIRAYMYSLCVKALFSDILIFFPIAVVLKSRCIFGKISYYIVGSLGLTFSADTLLECLAQQIFFTCSLSYSFVLWILFFLFTQDFIFSWNSIVLFFFFLVKHGILLLTMTICIRKMVQNCSLQMRTCKTNV